MEDKKAHRLLIFKDPSEEAYYLKRQNSRKVETDGTEQIGKKDSFVLQSKYLSALLVSQSGANTAGIDAFLTFRKSASLRET